MSDQQITELVEMLSELGRRFSDAVRVDADDNDTLYHSGRARIYRLPSGNVRMSVCIGDIEYSLPIDAARELAYEIASAIAWYDQQHAGDQPDEAGKVR